MPTVRLGDIATFLHARLEGDPSIEIGGVKPLSEAAEGELSFLANPKYVAQLATTRASAVLVRSTDVETTAARLIVDDPYFSLVRVVRQWFAEVPGPAGVDPTASIDATAAIGRNVRIGAFVRVGANATIGDDVTLHDHVTVGPEAKIGAGSIIYPNVSIYHRCIVGARNILHSGVVIGADGYGFATYEGKHHKLPQIGIVRLGEDVEIGANSTIDRAALGETVIGDGTKIDNLVQIAHNVKIGKHCLIVSQAGIAGSTELGDYVVFGGQSGAAGHLKIGSGVQVAAQAAVMKDFAGPAKLGGSPARPLSEHLRVEAALRRLPELMKRMKKLDREAAASPDEPESKG